MTFAIIGYGTVGQATRAAAEFHGHECVGIIDPSLSLGVSTVGNAALGLRATGAESCTRLREADLAFVCVPTPSLLDDSCDTSAVREALADLEAWGYQGAVVIRSTVPPMLLEDLALNAQLTDRRRFLANPEFLRVRDTEHTSRWPNYVVIGGNPQWSLVSTEQDPWIRKLADFYRPYFDDKVQPPIFVTDYRTAAFYKYLSNVLIAGVISLADECWEVAQALGVDWETCHAIAQRCPVTPKTIRVDPEDRGFGGACLPKDVAAFDQFSRGKRPTEEVVWRRQDWPSFVELMTYRNELLRAGSGSAEAALQRNHEGAGNRQEVSR